MNPSFQLTGYADSKQWSTKSLWVNVLTLGDSHSIWGDVYTDRYDAIEYRPGVIREVAKEYGMTVRSLRSAVRTITLAHYLDLIER